MNAENKGFSKAELRSLKEISTYKWSTGFACRLCGSTKYYEGVKPYSRKCQNMKCKKEESATANTIFERLRIPLDAAVAVVRILSKQESYISTEELMKRIDKLTTIKIKPKAAWELMFKTYDCMDIERISFERDILVVIEGDFALLTGLAGGNQKYQVCRAKEISGTLIDTKMQPGTNYSVCKSNGVHLRGRGKDTTKMYDWHEMTTRFEDIVRIKESDNESRITALLKLYAFIMNKGTYKGLMSNLTTNYKRNKDLLYQRKSSANI